MTAKLTPGQRKGQSANTSIAQAKRADARARAELANGPFGLEQRLRESGRIAFARGVARRDCPLHKGSAARTYWLSGYDAARRAAVADAAQPRNAA